VQGSVGGGSIRDTFAPVLSLSLDSEQLALVGAGQPATSDVLRPRLTRTVQVDARHGAELTVGRFSLPVMRARQIGVGIVGAGLLVLLLASSRLLWRRRGSEVDRICARFGEWLVPIRSLDSTGWQEVVAVNGFEGLARLAQRYDRMILHGAERGRDAFVVVDDGVAYVYRPDGPLPAEPSAPRDVSASAPGVSEVHPRPLRQVS
jgi:hypothetical protein